MQPGANRTDIVADPTKTPGQLPADAHGEQAAREAAASAMPAAPRQTPGPLIRKSRRPNEPVTAGLPVGLGSGQTPMPSRGTSTMDTYRELVLRSRDPQLAILVGRMGSRR